MITDLDRIIEVCVVDGTHLAEYFDVDEHGLRTFFVCTAEPCHTYSSGWTGYEWVPIDQGDYET